MANEFWWDTSKHNGPLNVARIKARGVDGIIARSTIGSSGVRDIQYENSNRRADDEGMGFAAYGVNWPANRNPENEASVFVEQSFDPSLPLKPKFLVGDFELGTREHWAGHHLISGAELVDQAIRYMTKLEELVPDTPLFVYTGAWYWNHSKLLPHIDRGEDRWPLIVASYPLDPRQLPGLPPRYSPDVLDPQEININIRPVKCDPWQSASGHQWTSKGRGKVDGYQTSTFMDRCVLFVEIVSPPGLPIVTPAERIRAEVAKIDEATSELERIAQEV
jgi:hypothetical protein